MDRHPSSYATVNRWGVITARGGYGFMLAGFGLSLVGSAFVPAVMAFSVSFVLFLANGILGLVARAKTAEPARP